MRSTRRLLMLACPLTIAAVAQVAGAAQYRTTNFIAVASSQSLAKRVAERAEEIRKTQAVAWLGRELPRWDDLCPIVVQAGERYKASGNTSFVFRDRRPRSWRMTVRGNARDIVETVLPHEVMHTVLATYFGCPLPRWADEGVCVMMETRSTQMRLLRKIESGRMLTIDRLFTVDQYPDDVLLFYAQGFSVTRFLIDAGGRRKFIRFLRDGLRGDDWKQAIKQHYGYTDYSQLSADWRKTSLGGSEMRMAADDVDRNTTRTR